MAKPLLALDKVRAGYGDAVVLDRISLEVPANGSLAVLGRNGVGKSTLLRTLMGLIPVRSGEIVFEERNLTHARPFERVRAGIGYVPQGREIFGRLTVAENLEMGLASRPRGERVPARVFELFPNLRERLDNMGNQLSGGEQQMLSIARALLTNPSVLLMDEPTEGLAPVLVEALAAVLVSLRESELSIILVEQNSRVALDFSPRTIVMDKGRIVYDGDSATLRADQERLAQLIGITE